MADTLHITSPAFKNEGTIPQQYTGRGEDISPSLHISGLPGGTVSLVVVMDDTSHPIPDYNHWIIWNLPPEPIVPEAVPPGEHPPALEGAVQGRGYGKNRYRGPKPPFRSCHRYRYTVYALDNTLNLPASSRKKDLLSAMEGHILAQGSLVGSYSYKK